MTTTLSALFAGLIAMVVPFVGEVVMVADTTAESGSDSWNVVRPRPFFGTGSKGTRAISGTALQLGTGSASPPEDC